MARYIIEPSFSQEPSIHSFPFFSSRFSLTPLLFLFYDFVPFCICRCFGLAEKNRRFIFLMRLMIADAKRDAPTFVDSRRRTTESVSMSMMDDENVNEVSHNGREAELAGTTMGGGFTNEWSTLKTNMNRYNENTSDKYTCTCIDLVLHKR